jgi:hypothetical protein
MLRGGSPSRQLAARRLLDFAFDVFRFGTAMVPRVDSGNS